MKFLCNSKCVCWLLLLITENVTGLAERRIMPEAIDPKNIGIENEDDKFIIYYFIDSKHKNQTSIQF